jgi:Rrf2 family protein
MYKRLIFLIKTANFLKDIINTYKSLLTKPNPRYIIIDKYSLYYLNGEITMKYTKATNYALHIMAYFVKQEGKDNLSLQPIASHMSISPTYLSKILTQLVKADLIQSTPGVNGGYSLRKPKTEISFYDVIQAIEGSGALFTCEMDENRACHIEKVMRDAEEKMVNHLKEKRIYDII